MPKPASKRGQRIADLIQRELALVLKKEIRDPRFADVVITSVGMSNDLSWAWVYFTLLDYHQASEVEQALNKASGYFRHLLSQNSALRYTPKLHFTMDESIIRGERITELLKDVSELDEKPEPEA